MKKTFRIYKRIDGEPIFIRNVLAKSAWDVELNKGEYVKMPKFQSSIHRA